jgi:hypothetical protein
MNLVWWIKLSNKKEQGEKRMAKEPENMTSQEICTLLGTDELATEKPVTYLRGTATTDLKKFLTIDPDSLKLEIPEKNVIINLNPQVKSADKNKVTIAAASIVDSVTKTLQDNENILNNIVSIIGDIVTKVKNLGNILKLSDDEQKQIIYTMLDIIIDAIPLNIKIGGVIPIPKFLIKSTVKPILWIVVDAILDFLEKFVNKPKPIVGSVLR